MTVKRTDKHGSTETQDLTRALRGPGGPPRTIITRERTQGSAGGARDIQGLLDRSAPPYEPSSRATDHGLRVQLEPIAGVTPRGLLPATFYFQCPPLEELGWAKAWNHDETVVLSKRTLSQLGSIGLKSVSLSTLFVDYEAPWTFNPLTDLIGIGRRLEELGDSGKPVRLAIRNRPLWDGKWDVRMAATMRSLRFVERGGELDARYSDLEFSAYDGPDIDDRERQNADADQAARYRVRKGDTPRKLAYAFYGSYRAWPHLMEVNGITGLHGSSDLAAYAKRRNKTTLRVPASLKGTARILSATAVEQNLDFAERQVTP